MLNNTLHSPHTSLFFSLSLFLLLSIHVFQYNTRVETPSSEKQELAKDSSTHFYNFQYFLVRLHQQELHLKGTLLNFNQVQNEADCQRPEGHFFTSKGEKVLYTADRGKKRENKNELLLYENVKIHTTLSQVFADFGQYWGDKNSFFVSGHVSSKHQLEKSKDQILITSHEAKHFPNENLTIYETDVQGEVKRYLPYQPNLYFKSQKLIADLAKSLIELEQDVYLKKENIEAQSLKGMIYLENSNKEVSYYTLINDVKIKEKLVSSSSSSSSDPTITYRKAYAERLDGYQKFGKIVLTGLPKVVQGKDVIKGNKITIFEKSQIVEVDDSISQFILK